MIQLSFWALTMEITYKTSYPYTARTEYQVSIQNNNSNTTGFYFFIQSEMNPCSDSELEGLMTLTARDSIDLRICFSCDNLNFIQLSQMI